MDGTFGAYLRGFETASARCKKCRAVGSEPTYEDLKLGRVEEPREEREGSEPTYEDLKLDSMMQQTRELVVRSLPTRI